MPAAILKLVEVTFPDVTGKTIRAFGTIAVTAGTYATGGIVLGLPAFAASRSLDSKTLLRLEVLNTLTVSTLITYKYDSVNDKLQAFSGSAEVANAAAWPDTTGLTFKATYDRSTTRG